MKQRGASLKPMMEDAGIEVVALEEYASTLGPGAF